MNADDFSRSRILMDFAKQIPIAVYVLATVAFALWGYCVARGVGR